MKARKYKRISLEERYKIESFLQVGKKTSEIAKLLERPVSTISREIKRGMYFGSNNYYADHANKIAVFKNKVKRIESKLSSNSRLLFYVYRGLLTGWTPEQISYRIRLDYSKELSMRISYESIYKYIYQQPKGRKRKRLISLLAYSKPKRTGQSKRYIYIGTIQDRLSIDERPQAVNERKEVGHWESDLIIGKDQKSAIGTLVERVTRYTIIVKLLGRDSYHVVQAFASALNDMPLSLLKSITHDNGVEMSRHKLFTKLTNMMVYFAHPYSSWERGTNENTNGLIRRVFKKKTDFNKVTRKQLAEMQDKLNNRPRKVLGWRTPNEVLAELL